MATRAGIDCFDTYVAATEALSAKNAVLAMQKANVSAATMVDVLTEKGLTTARAEAIVATELNSLAEGENVKVKTTSITVTELLTAAMSKLGAAMAAHPFIFAAAVITAVSLAIYTLNKRIDEATQTAIDTSKELVETYKDLQSTLNTNTTTLSELSSEYATLSKGVDAFGNNISLTADEFNRYGEITSQILHIFPFATLIILKKTITYSTQFHNPHIFTKFL